MPISTVAIAQIFVTDDFRVLIPAVQDSLSPEAVPTVGYANANEVELCGDIQTSCLNEGIAIVE